MYKSVRPNREHCQKNLASMKSPCRNRTFTLAILVQYSAGNAAEFSTRFLPGCVQDLKNVLVHQISSILHGSEAVIHEYE